MVSSDKTKIHFGRSQIDRGDTTCYSKVMKYIRGWIMVMMIG